MDIKDLKITSEIVEKAFSKENQLKDKQESLVKALKEEEGDKFERFWSDKHSNDFAVEDGELVDEI